MKPINFTKAATCLMALPVAAGLLPSQAVALDIALSKRGSEPYTAVEPLSFQPIGMAMATTMTSVRVWREPKALSFLEERRFHKLAVKESIGTLTAEERDEIEALDSRRTVDKPLPPEAIVARERLFSKIDELLKKLDHLEQ